ncbi:MAG: biotin/lipoyl-containing protein [Gemmatimonadales bacterium]
MTYTVEIAGQRFEVEVEGDKVLLDGRDARAALGGTPGGVLRRLVRGPASRSFQALAAEGRGAWRLTSEGQRLDAVVLDPRARAVREAGTGAKAPHKGTVRAPMPGKVLRVLVEAGLPVTQGQALIVVEAMKMENELRSPGAGTVDRVHVRAGDTVEKGAPLIELK